MGNRYSPGNGWRHIGGSVYEREDGLRVHVMGVCRLPDGQIVMGNRLDESAGIDKMIRVNGGSRRRGLMAWANSKMMGKKKPAVDGQRVSGGDGKTGNIFS